MGEGEETKGSTTASVAAGGSTGSKSQPGDDDPDRLGGDIMTRSAGETGGAKGSQEDGEQPAGQGRSDEEDDDPVRGG